jgi:hypothetical protein
MARRACKLLGSVGRVCPRRVIDSRFWALSACGSRECGGPGPGSASGLELRRQRGDRRRGAHTSLTELCRACTTQQSGTGAEGDRRGFRDES